MNSLPLNTILLLAFSMNLASCSTAPKAVSGPVEPDYLREKLYLSKELFNDVLMKFVSENDTNKNIILNQLKKIKVRNKGVDLHPKNFIQETKLLLSQLEEIKVPDKELSSLSREETQLLAKLSEDSVFSLKEFFSLDKAKRKEFLLKHKNSQESGLRELLRLSTDERRLLFSGLNGDQQKELYETEVDIKKIRQEFCKDRRPRLHSIGTKSILKFQKESEDQVLIIPIEGRDLHPLCVSFGLALAGETLSNLNGFSTDESYETPYLKVIPPTDDFPDRGKLLLKNKFLKNVESEDQIEVHVIIAQKDGIAHKQKRVVTYSNRKFTLYEKNVYKTKVLSNRVSTHDFEAFPLPEEEVEKLYGPLVRDYYFVVDLSVRNTNTDAKLISTGMIRAQGRAIVKPATNDEEVESGIETPTYTVPVSVIPNSAVKMYTILDDEGVEQPRAKFIRSLEFVGNLASAVTAAFGGPTINKAANLFAGVFLDSSRKALPDRWPGFKRNLVEHSMPDLLKVPAKSVAGHKHLFFSKKKIDTLINDQHLFSPEFSEDYFRFIIPPFYHLLEMAIPPVAGSNPFGVHEYLINNVGQPSVKVIHLEFDQLDIPFEEVFEVEEQDLVELFQELFTQVPMQVTKVEQIKKWYEGKSGSAGLGSTNLTFAELGKLEEKLKDISKYGAGKPLPKFQILKNVVSSLLSSNGKLGSLEQDIEMPLAYGLARLKDAERDLSRSLAKKQLARSDRGPKFEKKVKTIESALNNSQAAVGWYENLAERLSEVLKRLSELEDESNTKKQEKIREIIAQKVDQLKKDRVKVVKNYPGIKIMGDSVWEAPKVDSVASSSEGPKTDEKKPK